MKGFRKENVLGERPVKTGPAPRAWGCHREWGSWRGGREWSESFWELKRRASLRITKYLGDVRELRRKFPGLRAEWEEARDSVKAPDQSVLAGASWIQGPISVCPWHPQTEPPAGLG